MSDEVRAFFAIDLEPAARAAAAELLERLRGRAGDDDVRWVRVEALHVTLRFLGNVVRERISGLTRRVGAELAVLAPFEIGLGAARPFPSARRARVIALELAPVEPLADLAAAVERGVVAGGLPPEPRPFRPHLTLGRLRRPAPAGGLAAPAPAGARTCVREAVLFRSELRPDGARYTPLERLALGGGHPIHP